VRDWLRNARIDKGITLAEMAGRLGITSGYLCEIERGTRQIDMALSMAELLSAALDMPLQDVINAECAARDKLPLTVARGKRRDLRTPSVVTGTGS